MSRYVRFRDFDWLLLTLVLIICALGVTEIYSATLHTKFEGIYIKQIYWIIAGVLLMFVLSMFNYKALLEMVPWMYVVAVVSLVAVLVFGKKYLGARRWIDFHFFHFQPSEWVKLILILAMAKYFADYQERELPFGELAKAGAIVFVPMLLVLKQPDLGTSLTYLPIAIMALFLGGLRAKHALIAIMLVGVLMPVVWMKGLKPYQKQRLTSFISPEADSKGAGYQVIQSQVAVGSGGLWGKGVAKGTQTQGQFLPVPQTDFIFAAWSEEHGFVGATFVLLLYFLVLMRLIHNAQTAPDRAGTFLIMGVVAVLAFHVLVNVGMVVGFMPVTGIPLPLMSYGGSSVLFTYLALGMVMNVRMRRFVN
ncbi:MAG TPA: rod shape-determining protein RodA [candidate division Zixibacteria bacterium]|nr:rod shape-determining protein RodA [candidate division Zixibacteria bacterium]